MARVACCFQIFLAAIVPLVLAVALLTANAAPRETILDHIPAALRTEAGEQAVIEELTRRVKGLQESNNKLHARLDKLESEDEQLIKRLTKAIENEINALKNVDNAHAVAIGVLCKRTGVKLEIHDARELIK